MQFIPTLTESPVPSINTDSPESKNFLVPNRINRPRATNIEIDLNVLSPDQNNGGFRLYDVPESAELRPREPSSGTELKQSEDKPKNTIGTGPQSGKRFDNLRDTAQTSSNPRKQQLEPESPMIDIHFASKLWIT